MESERRGGKHRAGYSDAVTETTDPDDSSDERRSSAADAVTDDAKTRRTQEARRAAGSGDPGHHRGGPLLRHADVRRAALSDPVGVDGAHAARLHRLRRRPDHGGQAHLPVRLSREPGDVIVFKGPPNWNVGYKSIRSDNTAVRWVQNALSFVGFVPPDENDLVKRVIAVGRTDRRVPRRHRPHGRRQAAQRAVPRPDDDDGRPRGLSRAWAMSSGR